MRCSGGISAASIPKRSSPFSRHSWGTCHRWPPRYPEIQAALLTIDRTTPDGRRDYALLATMFNTGARVQEILDLRPSDVQLVTPARVRLVGKGRKERLCPLWPQTAQLLRA